MKYLVVGDIHGCAAQLHTLIGYFPSLRDRRMVFLGDFVDVGPESSAVLDLLIKLGRLHVAPVFLQGNHDFAMREYLRGGDFVSYAKVGGLPTIRSYTGEVYGDVLAHMRRVVPASHVEFLESLRSHFETDEYLFSHTGYDVDRPRDRSFTTMVLSTHTRLFTHGPAMGKTAVCGHYFQYTKEPFVGDRVICLDTGCGILDGPLTAMLLPEYRFVQVGVDLTIDLAEATPRDTGAAG